MTEFDPDAKLADLKLTDHLVRALSWCGYNYLRDFEGVSHVDILRLPGVGGAQYRKLIAALGREPYPWRKPKKRQSSSSSSPSIGS